VPERRAPLWLALYLCAVIAATLVHSPAVLGGALLAAVVLAGPPRWRLLRRTLVAVAGFNATVSLGYLVIAGWQGTLQPGYLVLVNLRVVLLVFLGFWFVSRVRLLDAVAFSAGLKFTVALVEGQVRSLGRMAADSRQAFRSRTAGRGRLADRTRHAAALSGALLDKSMHSAAELTAAMRARGFFDD
jgi:cobalt/nickel transport system permease protein